MKMCALAAAAAALAMCAPAQAMEHKATIEHADGQIAADYSGTTRVAMQQIGSVGAAGRQSSLSCRWAISLGVERHARLGSGHQARRSLIKSDVVTGYVPGWCRDRERGAERIVARHKDDVHAAMMALVEQDRALIMAEADSMRRASLGG